MIANRANDRRLRKQLKHDREMRNRERALSLRKDVYLSAAEAVSAGIAVIARFADLEIPDNKLMESYIDKSSEIDKVHVIANERTAEALTNLISGLNAAYLRVAVKRYPLIAQKNQISLLQQQINSFSQNRDHMLELMTQFNLDGATDQHRWEIINKNFEFEQDRISKTSKLQNTSLVDLSVKQLQFMKECIDETNKLSRLVVPVILSARAELEMPIDEQIYAEVIERSIMQQEANIKTFMENILTTAQQGNPLDVQNQHPGDLGFK